MEIHLNPFVKLLVKTQQRQTSNSFFVFAKKNLLMVRNLFNPMQKFTRGLAAKHFKP